MSDVGEPKMPGAPSGHPPANAQTPSVSAPKPEVQSSGFGEPKQPGNTPVQPSPTTQVPIAAQDLADRKSLAPVIIAMNVVLPFLSIGILIFVKIGRVSRGRIYDQFEVERPWGDNYAFV